MTQGRSCLFKIAMASGACSAASMAASSSGVSGLEPSTTKKASWQDCAAWNERSTPRCSTVSLVSRMPAVSSKRRRCRPRVTVCSTASRVVPGMSVTMTRSKPASALSRLDFPAFGAPRIAACTPFLMKLPRRQEERSASSFFEADVNVSA